MTTHQLQFQLGEEVYVVTSGLSYLVNQQAPQGLDAKRKFWERMHASPKVRIMGVFLSGNPESEAVYYRFTGNGNARAEHLFRDYEAAKAKAEEMNRAGEVK